MPDHAPPDAARCQIVLERIDPSRNMARYYLLSIETTLFGDVALIRTWGRIGSAGRHFREFFREYGLARVALETWRARKQRRGYVIR